MDLSLGLSVSALAWIAFGLKVVGYLVRDELYLRLLLLVGTVATVLYYLFLGDAPVWDGAISNAILCAVNLFMIGVVIAGRSTIFMSEERRALYRRFLPLSPGQFRKLSGLGKTIAASDEEIVLTQTGQPVKHLYFVLSGPVRFEKTGHRGNLPSDSFVGEVALVTDAPASARVVAEPGAELLCWERSKLDRLFARNSKLQTALLALLNRDMSRKVAASLPALEQKGAASQSQ